MFAAK
jgi:hypothetical protein